MAEDLKSAYGKARKSMGYPDGKKGNSNNMGMNAMTAPKSKTKKRSKFKT